MINEIFRELSEVRERPRNRAELIEYNKKTAQALTAIYEIGLECIGADWELYPPGQKYRGKLTAVKKALNEQAKAVNGEKASQRIAWAKACGVAE